MLVRVQLPVREVSAWAMLPILEVPVARQPRRLPGPEEAGPQVLMVTVQAVRAILVTGAQETMAMGAREELALLEQPVELRCNGRGQKAVL